MVFSSVDRSTISSFSLSSCVRGHRAAVSCEAACQFVFAPRKMCFQLLRGEEKRFSPGNSPAASITPPVSSDPQRPSVKSLQPKPIGSTNLVGSSRTAAFVRMQLGALCRRVGFRPDCLSLIFQQRQTFGGAGRHVFADHLFGTHTPRVSRGWCDSGKEVVADTGA